MFNFNESWESSTGNLKWRLEVYHISCNIRCRGAECLYKFNQSWLTIIICPMIAFCITNMHWTYCDHDFVTCTWLISTDILRAFYLNRKDTIWLIRPYEETEKVNREINEVLEKCIFDYKVYITPIWKCYDGHQSPIFFFSECWSFLRISVF